MSTGQTARALGRQARGRAKIVALSVDADDDTLAAHRRGLVARPHAIAWERNAGAGEADRRAFRSPDDEGDRGRRARRSRRRPSAYEGVADYLLIDAKPPKDAALPGGNGRPFDWRLDAGFSSAASLASVRRARPRQRRGGDRAERRARRRRLLRRRERAGRQGRGQDQGVRRRGAARFRAATPRE